MAKSSSNNLVNCFIVFLHIFPVSSYTVLNLYEAIIFGDIPRMDGVWFHTVLNFCGFSDEQGITVYYDGVQLNYTSIRQKFTTFTNPFHASDGRIILGRYLDEIIYGPPSNDIYKYYSSVSIDELHFYNHILTNKEIMPMIE